MKTLITKQQERFDEIVGEIPEQALMQKFGKEFCIMCGRPTKNDTTVKELKSLILQNAIEVMEKMKEWAIERQEHYMRLYEENMPENTLIGYHADSCIRSFGETITKLTNDIETLKQ